MRYAAILEYDGSRYAGWQRQIEAPSVQAEVERALSAIANQPVTVTVAGRTDKGVHASAQVIHFDSAVQRSPVNWLQGTNRFLPPDIALLWVAAMPEDFHARFSALERSYRYRVLNRPARPALLGRRVTHDRRTLDVARMREAATFLIGRHDFTSFRDADCQAKSPVRDLRALVVERQGALITFTVHANAFLHHMVRNLAGVLLAIGAGEREPDWAREVLEARNRAQGGVTAPPHGLTLTAVRYHARFGLPVVSCDDASLE